jgi:hypothetical protein
MLQMTKLATKGKLAITATKLNRTIASKLWIFDF